jgi:hypothetical protein
MDLLQEKAKEKPSGNEREAMASMQMAMQLHNQEVKQREREMMMQVMMNSMAGEQAEEERIFQRAMEESKQDADPDNPNTDNMTYEQLLELEDKNGKVSKGLTPE